jgi:hypothetical protein
MTLRGASLALVLGLAACDSAKTLSDLALPQDAAIQSTFDGTILVRAFGEGAGFEVELYASPRPAPTLPALADGHCDVHAHDEGDISPVGIFITPAPADVDLGSTVTATDGALTVTGTAGTPGQYAGALATSGTRFSSSWTLTSSGASDGLAAGTLVTVKTPSAVTPDPDSQQPIDTTSGTVVVPLGGGVGAETFRIEIEGSKGDVDCYPAPGTTSFTVPASLVPMLDPMVTPLVWAESVSYVMIGERRVLLRVTSDNLD